MIITLTVPSQLLYPGVLSHRVAFVIPFSCAVVLLAISTLLSTPSLAPSGVLAVAHTRPTVVISVDVPQDLPSSAALAKYPQSSVYVQEKTPQAQIHGNARKNTVASSAGESETFCSL